MNIMKKMIFVIFATMMVASVFGQSVSEKEGAVDYAINIVKSDLIFPESFEDFLSNAVAIERNGSRVLLFGHYEYGKKYIEEIPKSQTANVSMYDYEPKVNVIIKDSIVLEKIEPYVELYVHVVGFAKNINGEKIAVNKRITVYEYNGVYSLEKLVKKQSITIKRF